MLPVLSRFFLPPLILIVSLTMYRVIAVKPVADDLVPEANTPRVIRPKCTEPRVATDDQLREVLQRMVPPTDKVVTNSLIHALRLWGPQADFGDPKIPTGAMMRDYFLNDQVFQQMAGPDEPPIFTVGEDGIRARDFDDSVKFRDSSSHHNDDLLATLAETGTPLDTPLIMRDGQTTVRQLLVDSMRRFHPARHEFEWSVISYLRYLYPHKEWRNKYDDRLDIPRLTRMCVTPFGVGPCKGQHRFEALVLLLNADDQVRTLSPKTRAEILAYMKAASDKLVASQAPDGSWSPQWIAGAKANSTEEKADDKRPSIYDKILITGHTLEWLALAPEEVLPPRENIVRAGQWLCNTISGLEAKEIAKTYGPYSHAARALCLWRGKEAFEMWQELNEKK